MLIDFMIAGVQKGGTTALYEMLREHPDVGMGSRKELHFFDDDNRNWHAPDYDRLERFYESGRSIYGEATPITIYWASTHQRIRAYNKNMRFVLLFRDPIERAYSHWCMEYARHCETLNFSDAIRDGRKRLNLKPRRYSYVERGFYGAQVQNMRQIFPASQFLYLLSDDLRENRGSVLTRIAEFLAIDSRKFGNQQILARTRPPIAYPSGIGVEDAALLKRLYAEDLKLFARTTGLDIERWPIAL